MSRSRRKALDQITSLAPRCEEHLEKVENEPESEARDHWRKEIRGWLRTIERRLPHVGVKTAEQWQSMVDGWRTRWEDS